MHVVVKNRSRRMPGRRCSVHLDNCLRAPGYGVRVAPKAGSLAVWYCRASARR